MSLAIDDGEFDVAVIKVNVSRLRMQVKSDVFRIFGSLSARITLQMPFRLLGVILRDDRRAFQYVSVVRRLDRERGGF